MMYGWRSVIIVFVEVESCVVIRLRVSGRYVQRIDTDVVMMPMQRCAHLIEHQQQDQQPAQPPRRVAAWKRQGCWGAHGASEGQRYLVMSLNSRMRARTPAG